MFVCVIVLVDKLSAKFLVQVRVGKRKRRNDFAEFQCLNFTSNGLIGGNKDFVRWVIRPILPEELLITTVINGALRATHQQKYSHCFWEACHVVTNMNPTACWLQKNATSHFIKLGRSMSLFVS